jgi:hypothetical protein
MTGLGLTESGLGPSEGPPASVSRDFNLSLDALLRHTLSNLLSLSEYPSLDSPLLPPP